MLFIICYMNVLFLFYLLKKYKIMKEKIKIILNTKHKEDIKVQMKRIGDEIIIQVIDKEMEDGEGHVSFDDELGQFFKTINKI